MRKLLIPALLACSLAAGPVAMAATPHKATTTTTATKVDKAKQADCAKQWKAQTKHTQTRKAFMAACEKA
jgi:Ni/Co efflux regulator RcnB